MRHFGWLWCVGGMVAVAPAVAQERATGPLAIQEHVYDNGLRLLVYERPGDHRVAAKIFTDMGAMNEVPGQLGAAHFLEHLMFKGTQTLGTTDWYAEAPYIDSIRAAEAALIEERNRARNQLRERGVFHEFRHAESTPRIDSLTSEIARLDRAAARFRDNGAMMRWYQAFGGTRLTATTEQEYMKFDINLPRDRVALFFRVEADRMRHTVFREFDPERMILVEQRLGDLNRATTPYYEQMNAAVGLIHPVFWPEGYLTDFAQYTRAYERQLYERYFVANNTTIVLVGGVRFAEMVPLVDRYFGWMPRAAEPPRVEAVEPLPAVERRIVYRSDELAPRVEVRYLMPGVGHPDRPLFDVALGVARRDLVDALAAADLRAQVNANTRVVHTERFGVPSSVNFEVVVADEAELARAEATLLVTLDRLGTAAPDPARVARVKKHLRTDWYRTALNADQLAFTIGHFAVMDSWRTLPAYVASWESATGEMIRQLAARYFVPANRTIGVVRPPATTPSTGEGGQ